MTRTDGVVLTAGTKLVGCALVPSYLIDEQWDADSLDVAQIGNA